jgi:bacillithiol system protein YtxJ
MAIEHIYDEEKLATVLQSDRAILYKHSNSCSISAFAMREIKQFSDEHPEIVVYMFEVREQCLLSQKIATRFNISHESPQVIVIQNGKAIWHASHFDITAGVVAAAFGDG